MTEYSFNIDGSTPAVSSSADKYRLAKYDNWNSIVQFPDFIEDETWLRKKFAESIGSSQVATVDTALIRVVVRIITIMRWFARRLPESKDIDLTPFIERILQDVGLHLPATKELPTVEWIREAKNWNEHKGTPGLIDFIGDLIGSPIEVNYPNQLLFTVGAKKSCLSGGYFQRVKITGTPTTGETLTVSATGIYVGSGSITYNLVSGQTLAQTTAGLVDAINDDDFFHKIGLKAEIFSTEILLSLSNTIEVTTSKSGSNISISSPTGTGGLIPWEFSKHARIRDGVFWSQFVYLVKVLEAQRILPIDDLISLLDANHPAGMQRFLELNYMVLGPTPTPHGGSALIYTMLQHYLYLKAPKWPTLDNGFKTSDANSCLDMHFGKFSRDLWQIVNPLFLGDSGYRRLSSSVLYQNPRIENDKPWRTFKRLVPNYDGTSDYVYADNDDIVFENVRENVGIGTYTAADLGTLTLRELGYASIDKEKQNMRGRWLRQLPNAWTEVTYPESFWSPGPEIVEYSSYTSPNEL